MATAYNLVLKSRTGWQPINCNEIWLNRQLLGFLIWRDIKIRYRQTLFGGLWAILQPLLAMLVFTFFFHRFPALPAMVRRTRSLRLQDLFFGLFFRMRWAWPATA